MKFDKVQAALLLGSMDRVIRYLNNEEGINYWLMDGVADGDTWEDILEYFDKDDKENEKNFDEMCRVFYRVVKTYGREGWYIPPCDLGI